MYTVIDNLIDTEHILITKISWSAYWIFADDEKRFGKLISFNSYSGEPHVVFIEAPCDLREIFVYSSQSALYLQRP